MFSIYDDEINASPKTLCDWVKNIRTKKVQMKRKLRAGGNLRVCAILSTALMTAEYELRRKQQERFNRWVAMQTRAVDAIPRNVSKQNNGDDRRRSHCNGVRVGENKGGDNVSDSVNVNVDVDEIVAETVVYDGVRDFVKTKNPVAAVTVAVAAASSDDDVTEFKQREEITNLWKSELSGLDAFMRNISSSCNQTHHTPILQVTR